MLQKVADSPAAHRVGHSHGSKEVDAIFTRATSSVPPLYRKAACACGGGCPSCRAKSNELNVSQPHDPAEQEADRVADQIMRMPVGEVKPVHSAVHADRTIHRGCDTCNDESETVQRKALPSHEKTPSQTPAHVHDAISSGGHPLDHETRSFFEPRFGFDLSSVRIHTDGIAGESARTINARAYALDNHIVFGDGEYNPASESGKHILAHELAHVRQVSKGMIKRQTIYRQPDLECAGDLGLSDQPLPAKTWVRCVRQGKIVKDQEQVLRYTETGEIFGKQRLIDWAISQSDSPENVLRRIYGSHEFSGSAEVREGAVLELALALREASMAERLERRNERMRIEQEVERQREEARKQERLQAEAKRKRARWLAGEGDPHTDILEKPRPDPSQDRAGVVTFQTYDDVGEVQTFEFTDAEVYGDWIERRLGDIKLQCEILQSNFFLYLRLDRKAVDETWGTAAWYQKPGLAVANPGISKVAIAYGLQGLRFCKSALEASNAASRSIKNGRGTPAGKRLNEALRLRLRAEHAFNTMIVRHDGDNATDLGRLQNISTAGDVATNFIPGAGQLGVRIVKNAAVRGSAMHSDPDAEFGVKDFLWQTAGDVAAYKVQNFLTGRNPGFLRTTAGGLASNQVSSAVSARDWTKLFDFDPLATGLTVVGAGAHSYFRPRQGMGGAGVPDDMSSVPHLTTGLPPDVPDVPSVPPVPKGSSYTAHAGGEGDDFGYELRPTVPTEEVAFVRTGISPDASWPPPVTSPEHLFNRLGQGIDPSLPPPLPKQAIKKPISTGEFQGGLATADEAYAAYNRALLFSAGREVGICHNSRTGEYRVMVGTEGMVWTPFGSEWKMLLHYHPNPENILRYRWPAQADFQSMIQPAAVHGVSGREFIEFYIPGVGRGRTEFGIDASQGNIYYVKIHQPDGRTDPLHFANETSYLAEYRTRTIAVRQDSPEYAALFSQVEQFFRKGLFR